MTKAEALALRNSLTVEMQTKQDAFLIARTAYREIGEKYKAVEDLIEQITKRKELIDELELLLNP